MGKGKVVNEYNFIGKEWVDLKVEGGYGSIYNFLCK